MVTVRIYLADGNILEYEVKDEKKAREHAHAIIEGGYRSVTDEELSWYPPSFIKKVVLRPFRGGYYMDKVVS